MLSEDAARRGGRPSRFWFCEKRTAKSERRVSTVRFEVNGQSYMLSFNNGDGRWYLITAGADGRMKAIPVISDEFGFVAHDVVPMGDGGQASIN